MIEKNLRIILRPVIIRRQRLLLLQKLSLYWFIAAFVGVFLVVADSQWKWYSSAAVGALCAAIALITAVIWYKSPSIEPDYKAIARNIEKLNPELKAVLLTAIEQKPQEPDGQFGFLQERVIGDALTCAKQQDWTKSVSPGKFGFAVFTQIATIVFFILVLSQLTPSISFLPKVMPIKKDYVISVSPGDITVELGSTVVITARFDELLPPQANLVIGSSPDQTEKIPLDKNLEDPVFGGVISPVNSDMSYYIEYADKQTQNYKITTFEYPALKRADVNIVYPAYTKLPEKTIKDTRQFSVAEGSQVTIVFTLNKPVNTAQLVAKDGSTLSLTVDSSQPNVFTSVMVPLESKRYELNLVDAGGLKNKVPDRFTIDVHKNMPAQVTTVFPSQDIEASALEEISLEAKLSDDYGLTGYGISYALAGAQSQEKQVILGQSATANQQVSVKYILALEQLKAEPSELLTYYFWADDMGPDGNTRRSVSDLYFAEVRPFEEIFRENQSFQDRNSQQQEQQQQENQSEGQQEANRQKLIELQKQIITATWNVRRQAAISKDIEARKENLDLVRQSQADALEQARSAAQSGQEQDSQSAPTTRSRGRN